MEENAQPQDFVQEEAGSSDAEAVAAAQPKMVQLRADNPDLSKFSLIAKARDLLDAELRDLLANAEADRKELEGLKERIKPLEEKVSHAEAAEKAAISAYFSEETDQYHEYLTDETKERLRSSGAVAAASPVKRKATKKTSTASTKSSGKRGADKLYTPQHLSKLLKPLAGKGEVPLKDVAVLIKTSPSDVLSASKRLCLKTGEILGKPKKDKAAAFKKLGIGPDYAVPRNSGGHQEYKIDIDLVLERLAKAF